MCQVLSASVFCLTEGCCGCVCYHSNHVLLDVQVIANARALGARLMKYGYKLGTDGTDNHLVLWDMRKEVTLPLSPLPSPKFAFVLQMSWLTDAQLSLKGSCVDYLLVKASAKFELVHLCFTLSHKLALVSVLESVSSPGELHCRHGTL